MAARTSRAQETRESEKVHDEYDIKDWETPAMLDTKKIPARPGMVQRWVRTKVKAEDDQNNVFRKINQGWKPRMASSVPEGQFIPNIDFNGQDVIGIHGNILMERPIELHQKHAEYNRQQAHNQETAVKENMFNVHSRGDGMIAPSMSNESKVIKGRVVDSDD